MIHLMMHGRRFWLRRLNNVQLVITAGKKDTGYVSVQKDGEKETAENLEKERKVVKVENL